jgi:hypothetical protein
VVPDACVTGGNEVSLPSHQLRMTAPFHDVPTATGKPEAETTLLISYTCSATEKQRPKVRSSQKMAHSMNQ